SPISSLRLIPRTRPGCAWLWCCRRPTTVPWGRARRACRWRRPSASPSSTLGSTSTRSRWGGGAQGAARDDVKDSEGKYRPSRWFTTKVDSRALPITLVAHLQHADLTTFVDRRKALDTWNLAYPDR